MKDFPKSPSWVQRNNMKSNCASQFMFYKHSTAHCFGTVKQFFPIPFVFSPLPQADRPSALCLPSSETAVAMSHQLEEVEPRKTPLFDNQSSWQHSRPPPLWTCTLSSSTIITPQNTGHGTRECVCLILSTSTIATCCGKHGMFILENNHIIFTWGMFVCHTHMNITLIQCQHSYTVQNKFSFFQLQGSYQNNQNSIILLQNVMRQSL